MARGDAYIWSGYVAGSGYTTFVPASGVEVCLTAILWSRQLSTNVIPFLRRTATGGKLTEINNDTSAGGAIPQSAHSNHTNVKIFVTNTNALWLVGSSSGQWDFFFSGIQTK